MATIIDAHMHVGSWDHPDFLGRGCTLDETVAVMRAAGVSGAGIMSTDRCDNAGLLADARRVVAGGGPALWLFAWVRPVAAAPASPGDAMPPGRADLDWVEATLAGAVVGGGRPVTGLKIHPSLSRVRISDAAFAPALELAAAHDLIVLVHCGRWQEMASYRFAIDAAVAHPRVRFLLAHAGGDTPPLATAAAEMVRERRVDNVWFEFSGLREYWVIERNVARLGSERYLMGSDYGLAHPLMYIGAVRGMNLSDDDRARILGGNARALYGAPLGGAA